MKAILFAACAAFALFACDPVPGPDCSSSFCGCWEDKTLQYGATVVDAESSEPIPGVTLRCDDETEIRATSDAEGKVAFEVETRYSPGCHYERCTHLLFHDPAGIHADLETTSYISQIEMDRIDAGDAGTTD